MFIRYIVRYTARYVSSKLVGTLPGGVKSYRHALLEVCARDRTALDLLRVENSEMARVTFLIINIRQQIAVAFGRASMSRHKDRLGDGAARSGMIDTHRSRRVIEMPDAAMKNVVAAGTDVARDEAVTIV